MPQDTRHPQYLHYHPMWIRCMDAFDGSDAIKGRDTMTLPQMPGGRNAPGFAETAARGTGYLPQPSGMDARDYAAYKTRGCWFNASARVRQGLKGLIFREPPEIVVPAVVEEHIKDITRTGITLEGFSEHLVEEDLSTGWLGILVDLPDEDQPANMVRPQWTLCRALQIINWYTMVTPQGETVYRQVILEEEVDAPDPEDPYKHAMATQWRELLLEDGVYVVRLWRKIQGPMGTNFVLIDERIPTRRRVPLSFIPFVTPRSLTPPPLLDVVDVNLSHYRTNADYQHELHMCSLATAVVTGWDNTEAELRVGSLTAWILPPPEAKAYYLEVSGHGLAAKLEKMKSDEAQMAVLGARLLEPQRRSVEAAETHQIRQSAELSIMEAYAQAAEMLLTKALRWHTWWTGVTEDVDDDRVTLTLNTDFLPTKLDAPMLTALVGAWTAGGMTQEDLYWNLKQGSALDPTILTFEDWKAKLEAQAPAPLMTIPLRGQPPGAQNGQGAPVPGREGGTA